MDKNLKREYKDISELKEWDKNPRSINAEGLERLKKQITKLGQYKPLIITADGTVIGGNMRLKAYRELGIKKVWVSPVEVKNEQELLEYALSDNDRAGFYVNDLLLKFKTEFPLLEWKDFAVDIGEPINIQTLFESFDKADELGTDYSGKLGEVIYEPKETNHTVSDLFKVDTKFDEDIAKISNPELRELFTLRKANFVHFDFEKLADYYAYQATPEEQRVFEKLALVLLDRDKLIEYGFSKLINKIDDSPDEYETE